MGIKHMELEIIDKENDLVPVVFQQDSNRFCLAFAVVNIDEAFEAAKEKSHEIIEGPTDTFYGQRKMLLKNPDGTLADVSSPISNFKF